MLSPELISIELSNKEALVLFEFLARFNGNESTAATLFVDQG